MRLLHIETLRLHTFYGNDIPPYAILSHTWLRDEEEVTFDDIQSIQADGAIALDMAAAGQHHLWTRKLGFKKMEYLCNQADTDGYQYVWIDTCCIQQSNSTELSEAINSMFNWYFNAAKCYAYLMDIDLASDASFLTSRWWTRAWTLQELLASRHLEFYDVKWQYSGSKSSQAAAISKRTGIDEETLQAPRKMFYKSIAQRMSWAAGRRAKRIEDRAYSLLGIFEISMSMQYGEGTGAFMRLQKEILKGNNDQTLFVWNLAPDAIPRILKDSHGRLTLHGLSKADPQVVGSLDNSQSVMDRLEQEINEYLEHNNTLEMSSTGMFADDPEKFKHCGQVTFHHRYALETHIAELNGAWRMEMPLVEVNFQQDSCRIALLPCGQADQPHHLLAILLRAWTAGNRFERTSLGQGIFTFLVDFAVINAARTEQLWVDDRWWVSRYQDPIRSQGHFSRSIQVRINVDADAYSFASALPSTCRWTDELSVLQYHDATGILNDGDTVVVCFKYKTTSHINVALRLFNMSETGLITSPKDESWDRIVIFAGSPQDHDWNERYEKITEYDLPEATEKTPPWTIQASISTRRIFNQLISTLEINGADTLENPCLISGTSESAEEVMDEIEHVIDERRRLLEAVKGPVYLQESGYDVDLRVDDFILRSGPTGIHWNHYRKVGEDGDAVDRIDHNGRPIIWGRNEVLPLRLGTPSRCD